MPHKLDSKFSEFVRGFLTPVRALQTVFHRPKLLTICLFPIFLTLVVAALCIYAVLIGAWSIGTTWFQSFAGSYTGIATGIFAFFAGIFTLYLAFQSMSILLSLLASPFNDWLAEETERALGKAPIPLTFGVFVRVFFLDLRKTVLTLVASLGFWFLAFVPGLGLLSPLGFALITTLTFISYPQSRRHFGVIECLLWMKRNFAASLGFGLSAMILFAIPVLDVFALPLSVVGGTLLFLETEDRTKKSEPRLTA
jgi:uncharacterized protein involved in cysteine biosynthesis